MKQTALATPSSRMQVEGGAGKLDLRHIKPSAYNEFGKLKVVVVQKPTYLGEVWSNGLPINEWEAKSAAPKKDVALRQHEQMVNAMEKHGAQVIEIPASKEIPEGTYTRDIRVVVDQNVLVANMFHNVRKPEVETIICSNEVRLPKGAYLEGGDIFVVDERRLVVGLGPRTNLEAVKALKTVFPDREVYSFRLNPKHLHIDCAMMVLPKGNVFVYPGAFASPRAAYEKIAGMFGKNKIETIPASLYWKMGGNIQFLDSETILTGSKEMEKKLRKLGLNPIHLPFDELHRGGGSYRCATLPLVREG